MRLRRVPIATPTHPRDGTFRVPDGGANHAAPSFHGHCKTLHSGSSRFPAEPLLAAGFTVLAFDRRLLSEMIEDDSVAAASRAERGFPSPVVIGTAAAGCSRSRTGRAGPDLPPPIPKP